MAAILDSVFSDIYYGILKGQIHCLISYVGGLSMSLYIMGLATIDPQSLKEHAGIHKISKFGVNRPNSEQDTAI